MNYKRMMKNSKAISPIFATLILIAIAVIAGVVVYMFTSGTLATMTAGGTAGQEKITVQGASIVSGTGSVTVYIEQTGGPTATINSLIIKDSTGSTVGVITALAPSATGTPTASPIPLGAGQLTTISGATPSGVVKGSSYSVTVTTAAGGNFISTQVVAS